MPADNEKSLKVAFGTLGCRSNYADTVELQASVLEKGGIPCDFASTEADVYVLNTCTVTDSADKTTLRMLRQARRNSPKAKFVVTGCMAEVGKQALEEAGFGDYVIGPGQRASVLDAILENSEGLKSSAPRSEPSDMPEVYPNGRKVKRNAAPFRSISLDHPLPLGLSGPGEFLGEVANRARYHLRVQEGCENSCTFCIIPTTRGRFSSRDSGDLLSDIKRLSELGYEEIVLTGTHLGGYGVDKGSSLRELLQQVLDLTEDWPSSPRFRLSSIDPNDVDIEMIDLILGNPQTFCNHLHLCVQAFQSDLLKRMNRLYDMNEVLDLVNYISSEYPNCGLGSDLICGFPGEKREDMDASLEVFNKLPFTYLHVFPYSEREGTAATRLPGSVDEAERKRRAARWRAEAARKKLDFIKNKVGDEVEIIVEKIENGADFAESQPELRAFGTSREFINVELRDERVGELKLGEAVGVRATAVNPVEGRLICEL